MIFQKPLFKYSLIFTLGERVGTWDGADPWAPGPPAGGFSVKIILELQLKIIIGT